MSQSWTSSSTDHKKSGTELRLRWFTPTNEVDLCGHATLATARVIFDRMTDMTINKVTFDTKSKGSLIAELDGTSGQISLDFPSAPPVPVDSQEFPALEQLIRECLGTIENYLELVESVHYSKDTKKLLICINGAMKSDPEKIMMRIEPNFDRMMAVEGNENFVRGIIITSVSKSDGVDFISRYFAPWNGINEDPVTGSAHTVLMPFWSKYHPTKEGSKTLVGKQCSKRGGILKCSLNDDRVTLSGSTEVIVEGSISV